MLGVSWYSMLNFSANISYYILFIVVYHGCLSDSIALSIFSCFFSNKGIHIRFYCKGKESNHHGKDNSKIAIGKIKTAFAVLFNVSLSLSTRDVKSDLRCYILIRAAAVSCRIL